MTHYSVFFNLFNPSLPSSFDTAYSYDVHGNTVGIGHDNKVNFNRTSRVLQFINQDYSVNNPAAVYTYNKNGLPTTVKSLPGIPIFIVPNESPAHLSGATLTYTNY
ncbi:MAG: hypothetical protein JST68_03425 [Bacteroidetes bacterium]|nr:hypothetical protein [Bacteroidota bacterium]